MSREALEFFLEHGYLGSSWSLFCGPDSVADPVFLKCVFSLTSGVLLKRSGSAHCSSGEFQLQ